MNRSLIIITLSTVLLFAIGYFHPVHSAPETPNIVSQFLLLLSAEKDCIGEKNGTAYVDNCSTCVGGNTGKTACTQDCNGDWGGTATTDDCGVCDNNPANDNTTCSPDCDDTGDNDGDRLLNCYETNTGVYVSAINTGTNPGNADTDGDKLPDGDEVLGTLSGLDLPSMGTNPLRMNILIEYDWFDDNLEPGTCSSHSHRPTFAALNIISTTFANAPNLNPDGTTGITIIHDYGQGGVFSGGNLINDADGVLTGGVNDTEFNNHKAANFNSIRNSYFHYVILPHKYNTNSTSSGQAELPGDDFIVSLYCYGTTNNVSKTIVHELGHNLNLRHGGNTNCNFKPNYNSVMNYKFQFPGIDAADCDANGDGILDYSRGTRVILNENDLNENNGVCGSTPIDWNGIGGIQNSVVYDINDSDTFQGINCGGILTTLTDHNDWASIIFTGLSDADGKSLLPTEVITCNNEVPQIRK